ncbi:carbohydrate esterase family 9 protein [Ramaria rubella]|nr:carbohydrate esterase family 9 protein [Ramaria rubella]
MTRNSIICFTNCKLALEDGSLVQRDLWVDEEEGVILDAQKTFFQQCRRPDTIIDLEGDIISPGFIDVQINGAYGFDFSIFHNEDEKAYDEGLRMVAKKIVETGVTSLLPTLITQRRDLYPKLLPLLAPVSHPSSATLLGWHAEGPFLQPEKRGAHMPGFLLSAPDGIASFESVYGTSALSYQSDFPEGGVRIITAAPEIEGVIPAMEELTRRGVISSIGHSIAPSTTARTAIMSGARLITHLFNAMPQLHHRDPSIIGLLGAGASEEAFASASTPEENKSQIVPHVSEALPERVTPVQSPSPTMQPVVAGGKKAREVNGRDKSQRETVSQKQKQEFVRPFYGIIVDGCHSHPHSVRLAYTAHPDGCILVTDAMPILDPHLKDGIHPWRDGRRLVKQGVRLYVEGTETLAGSVVSLDICVRNFSQFTGCTLGQAIKCATYNPAVCLNIANRKGTLRPGADADLVLLDEKGYVKSTWVSGKKVWPVDKE